ncbi:hypothetical protein [Haloferax sp. Q22]|uniref:hypothetical protein n=1 Tax=Haloferax sp. (strain Q22) TaxID=1526048 RepID=UPI000AE49841|nr:hypothetical protein [Haloferax sp. Q22]
MFDKMISGKGAAAGAILLLVISAVFISGSVANDSGDFVPYPEQVSTDNDDINMSEGSKEGFLGFLDDILTFGPLSSVSAPDQVSPGETISFDFSPEAQQDFNLDGKVKVVEIYKCHDSSCENGEFVEAKSSRGVFDAEIPEGSHFSWTVEYSTPSSANSYFAATGYMSDGNGNVLTDTPRHIFLVGESNEGGSDDGSNDGSSGDDGSDGGDDSDSGETSKPPEIESVDSPLVVNISEPFTVSVEASDPDSPSLSYEWSNGKTGDKIVLSFGETGVKEFDVEVSDGDGNTVSSTVRVKVVEPEDDTQEPITDPKPTNPLTSFWNWFTGLFS